MIFRAEATSAQATFSRGFSIQVTLKFGNTGFSGGRKTGEPKVAQNSFLHFSTPQF